MKGAKTGGRQKGTPNKFSSHNPAARNAVEVMEAMGHNPIVAMVEIAQGFLVCNVCRGALKTKYKVHEDACPRKSSALAECSCDGELKERVCQSCYGTGFEIISPELRGKMNVELAKYRYQMLKQIEHVGEGLQPRRDIQITFVHANKEPAALPPASTPVTVDVKPTNSSTGGPRSIIPKFTGPQS